MFRRIPRYMYRCARAKRRISVFRRPSPRNRTAACIRRSRAPRCKRVGNRGENRFVSALGKRTAFQRGAHGGIGNRRIDLRQKFVRQTFFVYRPNESAFLKVRGVFFLIASAAAAKRNDQRGNFQRGKL